MNKEIKEIFELYEKQADNPNLVILIKTLKEWYFEKEDYKLRNEKAIKYINKLSNEPNVFGHYGIDGNCKKYLLNILQGDDKE